MGDWNFLGGILEEVHIHSTIVGKIWLTILFIFRMLVLGVAAEDVWNDEQSDFICNTEQPGCRNVCYDRAFPISLVRYWVLQVIFVSSPSLVYMGHALYRLRALEKARQRRKALLRRELELLDAAEMVEARRPVEREMKQVEQGRLNKAPLRGSLLRTYVAHVFTRSAVEVGFMAGQYLLYGFHLQPLFRCQREPCPNAVDCYVSRPTEKSVFMVFMQGIAGVSLLLNLLEIVHLGYRRVRKGLLSHHPHLRGEGDRLLDDCDPNSHKAEWAGRAAAPRLASAPSEYDLLLERRGCSTAYPNPLPPSLSLPVHGGEQALRRVSDELGGLACSFPGMQGDPARTPTGPPPGRGDPLGPGSPRCSEEGGGGDEEDDEDTGDVDLPGGASPKRSREAGHTYSCPALPGSRRQWARCSTVLEGRSSDTDSYDDTKTTGVGPTARTRPKSHAKRPGLRPPEPQEDSGSGPGPPPLEPQEDSGSGSQHSHRASSSNFKTSMGSCSSSRRAPDLQI